MNNVKLHSSYYPKNKYFYKSINIMFELNFLKTTDILIKNKYNKNKSEF